MWATRKVFIRCAAALLFVATTATSASPARSNSYQRISGEGSSWAANFVDAVRVNVRQFGLTVDFNPTGSTAGRKNYLNGTVDFAASDIPFQVTADFGSEVENPQPGTYAYIPMVAGGTAFMYNLKINGKVVTNLRLSGENAVKIFTGVITKWNDPAIQADNPGLTMPARDIVPVVRSDGSGSSAQLTKWMIANHGGLWNDYCSRVGRDAGCGFTSFYPTLSGSKMIAQQGDLGVAGYVQQGFAEGAIGYVNYSYALNAGFPVAKVLNAAGFYTEPTPQNVAVSLLKARINTDESNSAVYLTQDLSGVYTDTDPRNYQLSSYSYLIVPIVTGGQFTDEKGRSLAAFAYYAMCEAQQQSESLGYSPMPINLVEASFEQIRKIPGAEVQNISVQSCNNPTFSPDGTNELANNARQPQACDKTNAGTQCPDGTGGASNVPTAVNPVQGGAGGGTGGTGGGGTGGATGGSGTTGSGGGTAGSGGGTTGTGGGTTSGGTTGGSGGGTTGSPNGAITGGVTGGSGDGGVGVDGDAGVVVDGSACDPDTGIGCVATLDQSAGDASGGGGGGGVNAGASGGQPVGAVQATTLTATNAGSPMVVIALVLLLTACLVGAPLVVQRMSTQRPGVRR
jgi:ABC-type phosphate transport system substrate-binding protein